MTNRCRAGWIIAVALLGACSHLPPVPAGGGGGPTAPAWSPAPSPFPSPSPTPTTTPAPTPTPGASAVAALAVVGMITLPKTVAGLANAHDGLVVGTPITATDVLTGQVLGQGASLYDGSFGLRVPAAAAGRPVLLRADLLDARTHLPACPLYACAVLSDGEAQQTQDVGAGSTTWTALLARQAGQTAGDWTQLVPSAELGRLIQDSQPRTAATYAAFAEAGQNLGTPADAAALRTGIGGLVDKLLAAAIKP